MKKSLLAIFVAAFVAAPALMGQNLFPLAEFKFDPATAKLNEGQDGDKYSVGLFIGTGEKPEFIFHFQESAPNASAGYPSIKLDTVEKYKDGRCSLKFDFTKMNTAKLNRGGFMIAPPIEMKPGKIYEATIYIKTETPGMKLSATLMAGHCYDFKEIILADLLWKPYTIKLASPANPKTPPMITVIFFDIQSKGVFWVGGIEVVEKDAQSK